ncbi:hypothetical protein ABH945_002961 [Paraburkholderia sp. GAS333]|uniref:hypothetical protein n=1 Tax=Paraburkholderia sp. GAS333 TaxID=3156279 RepID=UPI003D233F14
MSENTTHDVEWLIPDPAVPIRQGDILIRRQLGSDHVQEICIVITADCDISKGKFGRQLACLRIIRLQEYISTIWASKKLEKARKDETEKARSQVAKWHTKLLGSESKLTLDGSTSWIRREDPATLSEVLNVPDEDRKKFTTAIKSFRDALIAFEGAVNKGSLTQLVHFRAAIRSLEIEQVYRETLLQAQKESLPEDTFLLPGLPQVEDAPSIVLLREVVGIPYETVHVRATDARSDDSFLRVGRLQPMFKYAISQAFGALYARIGLSRDYEARYKNAIDTISTLSWE